MCVEYVFRNLTQFSYSSSFSFIFQIQIMTLVSYILFIFLELERSLGFPIDTFCAMPCTKYLIQNILLNLHTCPWDRNHDYSCFTNEEIEGTCPGGDILHVAQQACESRIFSALEDLARKWQSLTSHFNGSVWRFPCIPGNCSE